MNTISIYLKAILTMLFKEKPILWVSFLIICVFIRFLPDYFAISELLKNYYLWVELFIIISIGMLIPHLWIWSRIQYDQYLKKTKAIKNLYSMSEFEKNILKKAYNDKTTTIFGALNEPGITALQHKGIVDYAGEFNPLMQTYIIPSYIWNELKKKHDQIFSR